PVFDTSFDLVGTRSTLAARDLIMILKLACSVTIANAYLGDYRGAYSSNTSSTITLAPAWKFPFSSPGKRFNVVQYAVTYVCNPTTRELRRYWNYGIVDPQPIPPAGGSNALLASNVAACSFTYANTGAAQRTGVVALSLQIQESGSNDSIQLFQQVHVTNVP